MGEHSWLKEKLMRRKTARIKVTNLRKFLARRKVQNVGRALKVINVLKTAARQSRRNLEESSESKDDRLYSRSFRTKTDSGIFSLKNAAEQEVLAQKEESSTNKRNSELKNLVGSVHPSSDTSDGKNSLKDKQVRRVNFESEENRIRNY